ncbi:MAG: 16S rRNA (uracil(1498)-N(3))-methyltransferase [Woeseiaceae bacterium]
MSNKHANRLYVSTSLCSGEKCRLDEDHSHYIFRVLRLRTGDGLVLFDGSGGEYDAVVSETSRNGVTVVVGKHRKEDRESPLAVNLLQGISRGDRMDFVVQKATELGVHRITPVVTEFSVVRLATAKAEKRMQHWTRVAQSACEQAGRTRVPAIDTPQPLSRRLETAVPRGASRVVLHPGASMSLATLKNVVDRIELLIGPEGGLSDAEYAMAIEAGFAPCSLGPRILRTETAAIAALALLQAQAGDLA